MAMIACVEINQQGSGTITIEDTDGNVVERFEVEKIRVEIPAGHIKPSAIVKPFRLVEFE